VFSTLQRDHQVIRLKISANQVNWNNSRHYYALS
jgi:hypothetical protein